MEWSSAAFHLAFQSLLMDLHWHQSLCTERSQPEEDGKTKLKVTSIIAALARLAQTAVLHALLSAGAWHRGSRV